MKATKAKGQDLEKNLVILSRKGRGLYGLHVGESQGHEGHSYEVKGQSKAVWAHAMTSKVAYVMGLRKILGWFLVVISRCHGMAFKGLRP